MNSEENKKTANDLWLEYGPYIRDLCKHLLKGSPDCADDCVQEVFLALTEALGQGKAIVYPKTWLNKVAHNIVKDVYRKAKKDAERLVPLDAYTDVDDADIRIVLDEDFWVEDEQIAEMKEQVISMLNEEERQLLYARYFRKENIAQIAKEQNTTENNVYQKLFRLKHKTIMLIKRVAE